MSDAEAALALNVNGRADPDNAPIALPDESGRGALKRRIYDDEPEVEGNGFKVNGRR
jgi:hypothetical protein